MTARAAKNIRLQDGRLYEARKYVGYKSMKPQGYLNPFNMGCFMRKSIIKLILTSHTKSCM